MKPLRFVVPLTGVELNAVKSHAISLSEKSGQQHSLQDSSVNAKIYPQFPGYISKTIAPLDNVRKGRDAVSLAKEIVNTFHPFKKWDPVSRGPLQIIRGNRGGSYILLIVLG